MNGQPQAGRWALDRVQGVAINDPFVLAVPVDGSDEAMVDLGELGFRLGAEHADDVGLFALTRRSVADRLAQARAALPDGIDLLIVEAYRPPSLQQRYFEDHLALVREAHPEWNEAQARSQASLHVAPPEVAPHAAGGAVDLTLCDPSGQPLDMGTAMNATPEDSENRCFTLHPRVDPAARENRNVLSRAMAMAGFVNFGPEWWHWSFGDRYWALRVGAPAAIFDVVDVEDALPPRR